jgi:hypothetical protein
LHKHKNKKTEKTRTQMNAPHVAEHSRIKHALRDLRLRCPKPVRAVFDIDGTLIGHDGQPKHSLCTYARDLVEAGCEVVIVTARNMTHRAATSMQLASVGLGGLRLVMYEREPDPGVAEYKLSTLAALDADVFVGDQWHDLGPGVGPLDMYRPSRFYVGDSWLKTPG